MGLLRPEAGLAALLVFANVFVAIAQFAEPLLFGRMIDLMTKDAAQASHDFLTTAQPMVYWLCAALVSILGGVLVSLHADRLSHRSRLSVMAHFFAHVLSLPQAFHNQNHSGRLLKIQFDGAGSMAWIWLSFFRDHCATLMMLGVLLPMTLFSNWRLAVILLGLLLVFALLTALVAKKTHHLQNAVETYHSSMAEHAADAIGNVSVVQSFTRVGAETTALRHLIHHVLSAQVPVLTWWAMASIMTRAATSLSLLLIFVVGVTLNRQGLASLGDVVGFMSFAGLLVVALVVDGKGRIAAPPVVLGEGMPEPVEEAVLKAVEATIDGNRKSDIDDLTENVRRAARRAAHDAWGKKPITRVLVSEL
jgi:ATP-binding cassette subfamily B protein